MAHIQRRKLKTGVSWRVRYITPDGTEKSVSFKRKADADAFVTTVEHQKLTGSYVDPQAGRQTVRDYLEEWRRGQVHHRDGTAESTERRFRLYVYPYIGDMPMSRIRPSTIRTWQRRLLDAGYAASTVAGTRSQVAGAFRHAIADRRIGSSPFEGVKPPEVIREKIVPWTVEDVLTAEQVIPDSLARYRAMIVVAAGTGLRQGELWGLTVDRVDFLRRTVRVDRQITCRRGGQAVFGPPKTKAGDRTVPVGAEVIDALAAHLARYPAAPGDLVFRTARGGPLTKTVFYRPGAPGRSAGPWQYIRDALDLPPRHGLHQLRHFYASLLIADGRNVTEVQERLGHASAQETLDTYSHLWPTADDTTRDAVDRAFAAARETQKRGATPKGDAASEVPG